MMVARHTHPNKAPRVSDYVVAMQKSLDQVQARAGWNRWDLFRDWLSVVERSLLDLPLHAEMAKRERRLLRPEEEPAETQAVWERMRRRYRDHWPQVAQAYHETFHLLLEAAASELHDWLGQLYMQWELGNPWKGQYFTPWPVAKMMAELTFGDPAEVERECHNRVKAALLHPDNLLGQAALMTSALFLRDDQPADAARQHFEDTLLPLAQPYLDRLKVQEPCVGSGVMILAAASCFPRWALRARVVEFFGQDIDETCVQMAKIQLMLYGLNGYEVQCELALMGAAVPAQAEAPEAPAPEAPAAAVPEPAPPVVFTPQPRDTPQAPARFKKLKNGQVLVQHGFALDGEEESDGLAA